MSQSKFTAVFPDWYNEAEEELHEMKGHLSGVVSVSDSGQRFALEFYDPVRLSQTCETMAEHSQPWVIEPGLIVVKHVNRRTIESAIQAAAREGFFRSLQPIPTS